MRISIWILVLLISLEPTIADVFINEIMYNPSGSDNNKEYIEVFSDEAINLTGYIIEDAESSDTLALLNSHNSQYSLIVEEGFNYSNINASIYSAGATIGNNLNNDGDIILFREPDESILDIVSYSDDWGGNDNGKSLERISIEESSTDPDNWAESISGGTPGSINSVATSSGCDWRISAIMNSSVSYDPQWQIRASKLSGDGKANITIKHWVEDSYGEVVKTYSDIEIENALSQSTSSEYNPSLAAGEGYFIKADITDISCEDKDSSNNHISELIFVQGGSGNGSSSESSLHIREVTPNSAEFGDIVKAEIDVYRGNTAKYALYAYVEDDGEKVSEKSTVHIKTKFVNQTIMIPIQLKPNCDGQYNDGKYDVVIEGLDLSDSEEIKIEGITSSLCKESSTTTSSSESESSKKFEYEIASKPNEIEIGSSFETEVKLTNNDDEDYDIEIWSYVYNGNKCYSGEREENKESFNLKAGETETVTLENTVNEASPGEYSYKVKIRKNDQKTTNDITETLKLVSEAKDSNASVLENLHKEKGLIPFASEAIVYESTSFKSKQIIPYLFILALVLLVSIMLWKPQT